MAKKMTMHQELDMLRLEVVELRKQKQEREKIKQAEAEALEEKKQKEIKEGEEKAEEIRESLEDIKSDGRDQINSLLDTIKKDYENLSPVTAVLLFALGAAFGRALDSK